MSIWMRWSAKAATLPILLLACLAVVVFAVSAKQAAIVMPAPAFLGPDPTPAEARQALIEMIEKPPVDGKIVDWSLRSTVRELRQQKAMAIIDDADPSTGLTWTFNCNLKQRKFSFFASKQHGCSFRWVGDFVLSGGRWTALNLHWDMVACSK